ncbi:MAG TPA: hypothetical protein VE615_13265 [Gaiellaceae bacterium]|nr:hypothetical protein [Gaiellaceae bacterium]
MTWRVGAFAALFALLAIYYAVAESLTDMTLWWEVVFLGFVLIPAVFGLVYLALPLWRMRWLFPAAVAFALLAVALELLDWGYAASFAKLAALTLVAFWFLGYFETLSWIVIVALIIPVVDAFSVFRGPTRHIVTEKPSIFDRLSFAFPVPGEPDPARLGPPDLMFFALFLAASARWNLRVGWTFVAMALSFGGTLALAVWLELSGLPALPFLSLGFLLPNADLLWRRLVPRQRATAPNSPSSS